MLPVGEGPQYSASPGFTDRLSWTIDPTTYNDQEYALVISVCFTSRGGTPIAWQQVVTLPSSTVSFDYQDPTYVVSPTPNSVLPAAIDVHYRLQLIRRIDNVVRWTSVTPAIPRTLGQCRLPE